MDSDEKETGRAGEQPGSGHDGGEEPDLAARASLENAARTALGSRVGHVLSDLEWSRNSKKLVELVTILRAWDRPVASMEAPDGTDLVRDELQCAERKAA